MRINYQLESHTGRPLDQFRNGFLGNELEASRVGYLR
jgi:hypothetical protein